MKTRFSKFIVLEGNNTSPEEAANLIFRDCKKFLGESMFDPDSLSNALWRGLKIYDLFFEKFTTIKDRKPANSSAQMHETLDKALEKISGTRFRSDATFVTGQRNQANTYGLTYLMFPIGDFDYCWSPKIHDTYSYFPDKHADPDWAKLMKGTAEIKAHGETINKTNKSDHYDVIYDYIVSGAAGYQFDDLPTAINSHKEIMIQCDEYYVLFQPFPQHIRGNANQLSMLSDAQKVLKALKDLM